MFTLRLVCPDDIKNVFNLSNDDLVRANSINKNKISWDEHVNWFNKRIKNTTEPFYVVEDEEGHFISQVRFNLEDDNFVISISIHKSFRGKGLGAKIIQKSCEKLIFECGTKTVIAYIKPDNIASKKSFINAGFIFSDMKVINGENFEKFVLN